MVDKTHYGSSMNIDSLMENVRLLLTQIGCDIPNTKVILFYSGMSGVASATAFTMLAREIVIGQVYVRKPTEKSHGTPVEVSAYVDNLKDGDNVIPVFIDDFEDMGSTFAYVRNTIGEYLAANDWKLFRYVYNRRLNGLDLTGKTWWKFLLDHQVCRMTTDSFGKVQYA